MEEALYYYAPALCREFDASPASRRADMTLEFTGTDIPDPTSFDHGVQMADFAMRVYDFARLRWNREPTAENRVLCAYCLYKYHLILTLTDNLVRGKFLWSSSVDKDERHWEIIKVAYASFGKTHPATYIVEYERAYAVAHVQQVQQVQGVR